MVGSAGEDEEGNDVDTDLEDDGPMRGQRDWGAVFREHFSWVVSRVAAVAAIAVLAILFKVPLHKFTEKNALSNLEEFEKSQFVESYKVYDYLLASAKVFQVGMKDSVRAARDVVFDQSSKFSPRVLDRTRRRLERNVDVMTERFSVRPISFHGSSLSVGDENDPSSMFANLINIGRKTAFTLRKIVDYKAVGDAEAKRQVHMLVAREEMVDRLIARLDRLKKVMRAEQEQKLK